MDTVTIAGRTFPVAMLICPPDDRPTTDADRSLGGGTPNDLSRYVLAENGLLFMVEPEPAGTLTLALHARTCIRTLAFDHDDDDDLWLPHAVTLVDGELTTLAGGVFMWMGCEPEWVVETIDRLSRKAFTQPPGPAVRLVPLPELGTVGA